MIDKKYEVKEHKVIEKTLVSERRYCDICHKEITGPYWNATTGHNDWGNDYPESVENIDVCSVKCLGKVFDDYCKMSCSPYNTRWIEVEHHKSAGVKGVIEFKE